MNYVKGFTEVAKVAKNCENSHMKKNIGKFVFILLMDIICYVQSVRRQSKMI